MCLDLRIQSKAVNLLSLLADQPVLQALQTAAAAEENVYIRFC